MWFIKHIIFSYLKHFKLKCAINSTNSIQNTYILLNISIECFPFSRILFSNFVFSLKTTTVFKSCSLSELGHVIPELHKTISFPQISISFIDLFFTLLKIKKKNLLNIWKPQYIKNCNFILNISISYLKKKLNTFEKQVIF